MLALRLLVPTYPWNCIEKTQLAEFKIVLMVLVASERNRISGLHDICRVWALILKFRGRSHLHMA